MKQFMISSGDHNRIRKKFELCVDIVLFCVIFMGKDNPRRCKMKSREKATLALIFVAIVGVLGFKACDKNENKQRREEKRAIENLGQFIVDSANAEVMARVNRGRSETNIYKNYTDEQLAGWMDIKSRDSAVYANALKRDAVLVYSPQTSNKDAFTKILKAPLYDYGPGTEFDKDGNATYNPKSVKGVSRLHNMKVNLEQYEEKVLELSRMRAEQVRRRAQ
ncbi:MAG: hypothetical protein J6T57_02170 [Alphaproteobacteria bacterium]|nr:hypothetical protein [Alphaproteobacteria bacterium]